MSNIDRPLSPHLSIYRWPITMALSILHRMTGVALSLGFVVLAIWLFDIASGADAYAVFMKYADSWLGWSLAFFYHLSNGVRHLYWDTGRGLEKEQATRSAWLTLIAAVVLTAVFWGVAS